MCTVSSGMFIQTRDMIENIKQIFDEKKIVKKMFRFTNMDVDPIIKIFDHLKEKIQKADDFGLRSLD